MQLNLESSSARYQIKGYKTGCVTINQQDYVTSVIVMPEYLTNWSVTDINQLTEQDLLQLLELKPEVILLGTGNNLIFPSPGITQVIGSNHVGLEIMTTAAACRTFTILAAERRAVLAALVV